MSYAKGDCGHLNLNAKRLTSALDGGWVVNATPRPIYPQERPSTHCIGGWVGPKAGLDRCGKSHPQWIFDPRTPQPVVSHYTDCAYKEKCRNFSSCW